MQIHISDSFQIAAETVNVGEKYRTAFRTTIMANNAIASPTQVIGGTRCAPGTHKEAVVMMIMMRSDSRLDAEFSEPKILMRSATVRSDTVTFV